VDGGPPERLVALAHALLRDRPQDPERTIGDLAAIRAECDRFARHVEARPEREAAVAADLRRALAKAGLGAVAPAGASIAAIQASLRRLHGIVSALVVTRFGKRPPPGRPRAERNPNPTGPKNPSAQP
jgi:hypothetical protein